MTIRFVVGTVNGIKSSRWTAEVRKADIYISTRPLGGVIKVSLHSSGACQFSFTPEFKKKMTAAGQWSGISSRHITTWHRPAPIPPGVVVPFRLRFPYSDLQEIPWNSKRKVDWIPPPLQGQFVEVMFVFTLPGIPVSGWPGKNASNTQLLSRELLSSGETLWVVYQAQSLPDDFPEVKRQLRALIHPNIASSFQAEEGFTRAVTAPVEVSDHSWMSWELSFPDLDGKFPNA